MNSNNTPCNYCNEAPCVCDVLYDEHLKRTDPEMWHILEDPEPWYMTPEATDPYYYNNPFNQ